MKPGVRPDPMRGREAEVPASHGAQGRRLRTGGDDESRREWESVSAHHMARDFEEEAGRATRRQVEQLGRSTTRSGRASGQPWPGSVSTLERGRFLRALQRIE